LGLSLRCLFDARVRGMFCSAQAPRRLGAMVAVAMLLWRLDRCRQVVSS
jgi:hypothetical protein